MRKRLVRHLSLILFIATIIGTRGYGLDGTVSEIQERPPPSRSNVTGREGYLTIPRRIPEPTTIPLPTPRPYKDIRGTITFYCCCDFTSSGKRVSPGMVANTKLSFGTEVWIEGLGDFIVEDRGLLDDENHFDVYLTDCNLAWKYGRWKEHTVRIYGARP